MQRDLSTHDIWEESLRRSRERRERAAAQRQRVELPARGVSLAAAIALTGGTAVAIAATDGGDAGVATATGASGGGKLPATAVMPASAARPAEDREPRQEAVAVAVAAAAPAAKPAPAARPAPTRAVVGHKRTAAKPQAVMASAAVRRGGGVADLQHKLGVTVDGDFGRGTERALKRWQRKHDLTADGVVGPETRRALGLGRGPLLKRKRTAPRRHHRAERRSGGGVGALQRALGVSADGVFGPGTEQALKSWQREHGLAADGVAGPQTRRALGIGPGPLLKRRHGGGGGGGGGSSVVQRVIAAANAIATKPYQYGGGHGSFVDSGYDCSGSVSYALHGGGLLASPLDSSAFMSYGLPGPGRHITIYASSGHAYMTIDGRRFDTSARWETGSRWSSTQRSSAGYVLRHPRGL